MQDTQAARAGPDYGRRLLSDLIHEIALREPEKPFVSLAKTSDPHDGFDDFTYGMLDRAIDAYSWWIVSTLGQNAKGQEPLCTALMPQDIRHVILTYACIKTGYVMVFTSPAISIEGILHLWRSSHCRLILMPTDNRFPKSEEALKQRQMLPVPLPDLHEMLAKSSDISHFPYNKTFEEGQQQLMGVFHSSGSTGDPKPLPTKQALDCAVDSYHKLRLHRGKGFQLHLFTGKRVFVGIPLSIYFSFIMTATYSVYYDYVPVLVPQARGSVHEVARGVHLHGNVQISILGRPVIIETSNDAADMDAIERLDFIFTAGAPVPFQTGNKITTRTRLLIAMGMTEVALFPLDEIEDPADWSYFNFNQAIPHEMRQVNSKTSHMILVRRDTFDLGTTQGVFIANPHLEEFPTGDLYEQHPTKQDYWRHCGRVEDVLTFSGGQIWNPVPLEAQLAQSDGVSAALVCGNKRDHAILLIERSEVQDKVADAESDARLVDNIWPMIEASMQESGVPAAILTKSDVLFTSPGKLMVRTPAKRTIQRHHTLGEYEKELNGLYKTRKI